MDSTQLGGNEKQSPAAAEIDTSAPFESVKEAASRFGGMGFWRPNNTHSHSHQNGGETMDIAELEEQAAQLERDLALKERETLEVLKELETTKMVVEELKSDLQKEASEVSAAASALDVGLNIACPNLAPGNILMELKQAKLNLGKTTDSLADIRATVESYSKKIEKERASLEKTRQRLSSSASKVSSLETELNQTKETMELVTCVDIKVGSDCNNNMDLAKELQRLSSETEQFKKVGEAARSEVSRAISEMEHTRMRIKTTESRLVAAKKMKEAARAAEAVALAEIKALSNGDNGSSKADVMTISFEEYSSLMSRVREAEANCESKLANAANEVEGANVSKDEILKKVEEATEEVKSSKMVLEEALSRVENANKGKLAVEEALRKWRSERRGQKKRLSSTSAKFKNPGTLRKDSCADDDDVSEELMEPVLKPTISIGQILSRKLLLKEEFEKGDKSAGKRKVSLAQMLGKHYGALSGGVKEAEKENAKQQQLPPTKRKKFGLAKISLLVAKQQQQQQQSKKKKRQSTFASGCMMSQ